MAGGPWRDRYEYVPVRSRRPSLASDVPPRTPSHPAPVAQGIVELESDLQPGLREGA